jgi:hypothetical protein
MEMEVGKDTGRVEFQRPSPGAVRRNVNTDFGS